MHEIEAISGVFFENRTRNQVLLLRRNPQRTFSPNLWDLMGGDIKPQEPLIEAIVRDATEKLNISSIKIDTTTTVITPEENAIIKRYVFICSGNYLNIAVDEKKYNRYGWFSAEETKTMDLTNHARIVLHEIGFTS